MIDLKELKNKVRESERLRNGHLGQVLTDFPDEVTEDQYLALLPVILRLGKN